MHTSDTINRKLAWLINGQSRHWYSSVRESCLLWCNFIGSTCWPQDYWIHHRKTYYLDVQKVEKGQLAILSGNRQILVPEKTIALIPPGEYTLKAVSPGGVQKKHFGLTGQFCLNNLASLGLDKILLLNNGDRRFEEAYDRIFFLAGEQNPAEIHEYSAQVFKMMLILSDLAKDRNLPQTLADAKYFMECNFSRDLDLQEICSQAGCGKTVLQNQFRRCLDTTPIKYLSLVRMKYAEKLLLESEYPVKTIAAMCGFRNPLYFSNVFKEYSGCYPREYRKRNSPENETENGCPCVGSE